MTISEQTLSELFQKFSSSREGLSSSQIYKKQKKYGKNFLPEKKKSRIKIFFLQFYNPLVFILFGAIAISLIVPLYKNGHISLHDSIDSFAIFFILLLNAIFGFVQELKAENTLQALKNMQPSIATVIRDGKTKQIAKEDLVPGDIIIITEGNRIPADARVIETHSLKAIESALTGESAAVTKDASWKGKGGIADQKNMLFSGTLIAVGRAVALVVATGKNTEIGKIATLVSTTESPKTPLEKRLERLGKRIGFVVIFLCLLVFLASFFHGMNISEALITSVALAVSAVPEGLPAVMTISLAIGVGIMAKKKALVRELRAVETLGSVTVIASDKTGTITENKMQVTQIYMEGKSISRKDFSQTKASLPKKKLLNVAINCNDAQLPNIGDPTELALLEIALENKGKKEKRKDEVPFSSETKWMSTTHIIDGKEVEFIKGAPEVIAKFCLKTTQEEIQQAAKKMAKNGLRTIAAAVKEKGKRKAEFLGIFGLSDPPRKTAKRAIQKAKKAGIRTVMITGDHVITASAIAKKVGISGETLSGAEIEEMSNRQLQKAVKTINIFARVSPEHKVRICAALQKNGEIVSMTGDGVNDAPALHKAEVGISMGKVGTSVARQSSDLVLMNDHYATIVAGVEEGRRIYSNIKKSISFLMRTNFDEVLLVMIASFLALPLPMLPIHILFLNLLSDSFPALSLAMEPAEKNIMKKSPRPIQEGFLSGQWKYIVVCGVFASITEIFIFLFALEHMSLNQAQTLILTTVIFIEFALIFSVRTNTLVIKNKTLLSKNPWIFRAVFLGGTMYALALFTPLQTFLQLSVFPVKFWIIPFCAAAFLFVVSESLKWVTLRNEK
jgi:Ca2+-transporting ATPase